MGYRVRRLCTTLLLETVFQVGVAIGLLGKLIARHFVLGLGTGAAFAQDTIEPMLWLGFHRSLRQPEGAITGYRVPPPSATRADVHLAAGRLGQLVDKLDLARVGMQGETRSHVLL